MKLIRVAQIAAIAVASATLLVACGSPASTPATSATTASGGGTTAVAQHNAADTTFAQMMVVHHEGAVEMAELAEETAESSEVRSLASRIKGAQGPEIDQMRGWLEEWGEPAPEDSDMGGMGHGGMDMGGLDQQAAMDELTKLTGSDFDQRFLTLMIQHHEGAISMAEQQIADGENEAAIGLAEAIISAQQKEIAEMQGLLEGLD